MYSLVHPPWTSSEFQRSSVKSAVGLLKEYYPHMRSEWPLAGLQRMIEQIQTLRACLFGDCLQPTQFKWKSPSYGGLDQPKSSTLSDYRRATVAQFKCAVARYSDTGLRNMNSFPDPHIKIRGGARISFRDIFVNLESQSARFAGVCTVCMCWSFILSAKWVTADSTGSSKTCGQCGPSWLLVGLTCTWLMLFWSTLVVTRPAGSCLLVLWQ